MFEEISYKKPSKCNLYIKNNIKHHKLKKKQNESFFNYIYMLDFSIQFPIFARRIWPIYAWTSNRLKNNLQIKTVWINVLCNCVFVIKIKMRILCDKRMNYNKRFIEVERRKAMPYRFGKRSMPIVKLKAKRHSIFKRAYTLPRWLSDEC